MRLKRVVVTGYKSIKETTTLYVNNNVSVSIGANDHGKSNLLEAVELLNEGRSIKPEDVNWDLEHDEQPSIEWHFLIDNEMEALVTLSTIATEPLTPETENLPSENPEEVTCEEVPGNMLVLGMTGINQPLKVLKAPFAFKEAQFANILQLRPLIELIKNPGDKLPDSVTLNELNGDGQEFMRGIFMAAGIWENREQVFNFDPSITTKTLENASKKLTAFLKNTWKQSDLAMVFSHQGDRIHLLIVDPNVTSRNPLPSTKSSGFRSFFYLSMVTRAKSSESNRRIFLFDEPGMYLHPIAQFDLQRGFEKISDVNQIIYTTHSPFLISRNYPERNRVISKTTHGTKIDSKPFSGNWKSVSKSLGVLFGQYQATIFANRILVTEGPSDYLYIFSAIRLLNLANKIDIDINGFSCIDAKDSDAYVSMVKGLVVDEEKTVVCMFDGDEGGADIKKGLDVVRANLPIELQDKIILSPLPVGKSTEDVFANLEILRQATVQVAQEIHLYSTNTKLIPEVENNLEELAKEIKSASAIRPKTLGKILEDVTKQWTNTNNLISKFNIALKYLELALPSEEFEEENEESSRKVAIKIPDIPSDALRIIEDLKKNLELKGKAEVDQGAIEKV
jgi:predicted ATP-dependent endonuclease of OLD family